MSSSWPKAVAKSLLSLSGREFWRSLSASNVRADRFLRTRGFYVCHFEAISDSGFSKWSLRI